MEVVTQDSIDDIKAQYQIPESLNSCHTAIVDGYVIEGHVPAAEVVRLIEERPEGLGIAVAGMPPGSPGMDIPGFETDPFDVILFNADGSTSIFASYPK